MNNKGRLAEMKAANYLREKGYCLIEHSYKSRFGEIDLIFEYKNFIVFVEVKARGENSIAQPREFVDEIKQKKIISTANLYMSQYKVKLQPRFDVIEVFLENNRIKSIKHLENAFSL
ncbi:YraN family protein [uncultured Eubacterium sp.]|uniref:YraN family protein n=1 Tax=uncultured Eubacterium sp. TaxID=165185 RepID=UPI00280410C1|nr:YraN family protein [uncultured Eubacterium sp.]